MPPPLKIYNEGAMHISFETFTLAGQSIGTATYSLDWVFSKLTIAKKTCIFEITEHMNSIAANVHFCNPSQKMRSVVNRMMVIMRTLSWKRKEKANKSLLIDDANLEAEYMLM